MNNSGKGNHNRPSKAQTVRIVVFVLQIIATFVIPLILVHWNSLTIDQGVAILIANTAVLFLVNEFTNSLVMRESEEKSDEQYESLKKEIAIIEDSIKMDYLYKRIYMLGNNEQKEIYLNSMRQFLNTMNDRIAGTRSGGLSRHDYYGKLMNAAEDIIADHSSNEAFSGEIWAMTFWQDDELDFDDAYETAWVKKMEKMDELGIKTKRLCVMKNKKSILQRESADKDVEDFLGRLVYYCHSDAVCKNTILYAIDSIDTLTIEEQEWMGKGFFATKLTNGKLRLIRGVSLDNRNATTLGGEIDFDEGRVKRIRDIWERLIEESGSLSINEYLWKVSSPAVKEIMVKKCFGGNNEVECEVE